MQRRTLTDGTVQSDGKAAPCGGSKQAELGGTCSSAPKCLHDTASMTYCIFLDNLTGMPTMS
jgi:hypothetical protein